MGNGEVHRCSGDLGREDHTGSDPRRVRNVPRSSALHQQEAQLWLAAQHVPQPRSAGDASGPEVLCHLLRPPADRNTNLVSYPYYAKYAHKGDNTFFRHIDVNMKQLASSVRGANMIQGMVSLDNENQDDCTEILPGMHKHIKNGMRSLPHVGYPQQHSFTALKVTCLPRRIRSASPRSGHPLAMSARTGASHSSAFAAWGVRSCQR